jgi:hypothetical protein
MNQLNIIPELNYWMGITLKNSPVYETFHKRPSAGSEYWTEKNSVIDLLFNENFDPDDPWWLELHSSSSSSSSDFIPPWILDIYEDNDKRYIYKYRRCNLLNITDKNLLYRIQLYRWWANIWACNSDKFINVLDMQGSNVDPDFWVNNEVFLPFDVSEHERSPYITYKAWIYFQTNYPLAYQDRFLTITPPLPNPIYTEAEDPFDLTDQDHMMLELLYDYKTGRNVSLDDIDYSTLTSCIAKLVYIYLDAFINDSFIHYSDTETICHGEKILCTLYEKHVVNMLYLLKGKLYGVIWKDTEIINDEIKEIEEKRFMIMKKVVTRVRITEEDIANKEIILVGAHLPWNRKDFTIFKDGLVLTQDTDFKVVLDYTDVNNIFTRIKLLSNNFRVNEKLLFIWSYVDPYSVYSENDGRNILYGSSDVLISDYEKL